MEHSFPSTTPPRVSTDHRYSDDSYENDSYFFTTYVPLSNLPTPPPSSHSNGSVRKHTQEFGLDGTFDPDLLGPAVHLKNLIPSSVSLTDPCVHIVYSLLVRAKLPLPTIALAVCILDSLNSRFALSWRRAYPLANSNSPRPQQLHINSVRPEVIILAALIISVKFLDDQEGSTQLYSEDWGSGQWTCEQINATQQCIMVNLGYRILPLWTEELIGDALDDMETAGRHTSGVMGRVTLLEKEPNSRRAIIPDKAVWWAGNQLTPAEIPMLKNMRGTMDIAPKPKLAFGLNNSSNSQGLVLPTRTAGETFPSYTEPVLNCL